jgi:hypothetical protein
MIDVLFRAPLLAALLIGLLLAASVFAALQLGLWIGRRTRRDTEGPPAGVAAVEGSILGLFGLLLAFGFHGAAERFQARRGLILEEAQAVGTAWSRLELLSEAPRERLRSLFRTYLDRKIAAYQNLRDLPSFERELEGVDALAGEIQRAAAAACREESGRAFAAVIMPAVNNVADISTARKAAVRTHPPAAIFGLLFGISLGAASLVGLAMSASKRRSWVHLAAFSLMVAATLYAMLDMELPRLGMIRVDRADALLEEVRRSMDAAPPGPTS